MADTDLTKDHAEIADGALTGRYFAKFGRILAHLDRVAGMMEREGRLARGDVAILAGYMRALARTFAALSHKYMFARHRAGGGGSGLTIDRVESGFPVFQEILTMANDAQQAERHLRNMPGGDELREAMIREILGELRVPVKLQYAMAQRLYYQALAGGELFWARNDPVAIWLGNVGDGDRRRYMLHWAVYDSQINLPAIYLMDVEDTGREALTKDERRWPEVQAHLMAQSVNALKLLTIARGFDDDFADLHPKRLRRFHVGPMYSSAFTRQSGPLSDVLSQAQGDPGEDWALAWTVETLESERVKEERAGWFSTVEREIFALDPFSGQGADTGATKVERALILPQKPFQVLDELDPPGFRALRKFVVSPGGTVVSYR